MRLCIYNLLLGLPLIFTIFSTLQFYLWFASDPLETSKGSHLCFFIKFLFPAEYAYDCEILYQNNICAYGWITRLPRWGKYIVDLKDLLLFSSKSVM